MFISGNFDRSLETNFAGNKHTGLSIQDTRVPIGVCVPVERGGLVEPCQLCWLGVPLGLDEPS